MSQGNQLMFDVADYIAANPLGANKVPVITALAKDPAAGGYLKQGTDKMFDALSTNADGKTGLCVYVFLPKLGATKPDVPGPYFDNGSLLVLAVEDQIANNGDGGFAKATTPIRCDDLATYIARLLHKWYNLGTCQTLLCSFCNSLSLANVPDDIRESLKDRDLVFWGIIFDTQMPSDQLPRVGQPLITVGASQTTITIPAGSTVYYTVDGTLPTPTNGTAYTVAFNNPASGTLIRTAAYKSGLAGSHTNAAIV